MAKILVLDTYYDSFLQTLPPLKGTYEEELAKLLSMGFGTFDAYSHYLKALGHEVIDIIANYRPLQDKAAQSFGWGSGSLQAIALEQIKRFKPAVVFCQDLSFFSSAVLQSLSQDYLLAGQCSCPMPLSDTVRRFDVLFTSFPHYVEKFQALGVRAEYLPLAFDPRMLQYQSEVRDIDISFVGGVGKNSHWHKGTDALEAVAAAFPKQFVWYGYGLENLSEKSALRKCWRGFAWGRKMYQIYGRSKIGITRHGEVAEGYTNNLRCYEVSGMGALLMTETSPNLFELFPQMGVDDYDSPEKLVHEIAENLKPEFDALRSRIAEIGQRHTLKHHTYAHRMQRVSEVLTECLKPQPSIA